MPPADLAALLHRVPLFADLDAADRAQLGRLVQPFHAPAGEILFRQGAAPLGLYLVERGRVGVSARLFGEGEVTLAELGPNAVLGELSLVDRQPRSATARAIEDTRGAFLDTRVFDALRAQQQPSALKLVLRIARGLCAQLRNLDAQMESGAAVRATETRIANLAGWRPAGDEELGYLRIMPSLSSFSDGDLARLGAAMQRGDHGRGDVICSAGAAADRLFLVVRGAVEVQAGEPGGSRRLAVLGPGALFGHVALLDGGARSASCVVREDAFVMSLPAEALHAFFSEPSPLSFLLAGALVIATSRAVRSASRRRAQLSGEADPSVLQCALRQAQGERGGEALQAAWINALHTSSS